MVYVIPQREELQLNEETIWAGSPYRNENEKALHALPEARKLIFEGKTKEADQLVNETFFTRTHGMPYQTAGSVILDFPGHENYQDYYRELDINKAVATTRYSVNGVKYTREFFSSFVDDVIIMKLTSSKFRFNGAVHLLPAIPNQWKAGSVSGIMARGGFEVDMKWEDGAVSKVSILSKIGENLRIRSYVPLTGKSLKKAEGANLNTLLNPVPIANVLVSEKASLKGIDLKKVYEYDVPTEEGKRYSFLLKEE